MALLPKIDDKNQASVLFLLSGSRELRLIVSDNSSPHLPKVGDLERYLMDEIIPKHRMVKVLEAEATMEYIEALLEHIKKEQNGFAI